MKINARNRVLALLLTLAMLLPNLTGLVPAVQAAEVTTGTANVYDIYDLTGSQTNTVAGTDSHWNGVVLGSVSAEHKENIAFKTKLTMGEQQIRLALNSLEGNDIYDPQGYAVYINHNNGAPYITIFRNQQQIAMGSPTAVAGTWELEIGIVDILSDGVVTGKHIYVKKDGVTVCEADDTSGYLTGDALGTRIVDFHYDAAIQMDTTYTNEYGTATVYDIYDLTGETSTSVDAWRPTKLGTLADADKEQAAIKFNMNITDIRHRYRFAVGNTSDGSEWDPQGYSVEIAVQLDGSNYVKFKRNSNDIASFDDISGVIGEYDYEFGYRNITFGSNVIGKQVYLSVDGVDLYTYEDTSDYLTGEALGTTVSFNQIDDAGAVTLNSTYESGYGTVNVYDIADLTGSENNSFNGALNSFDVSTLVVPEESKENVALKAMLSFNDLSLSTNTTELLRLSLSATQTNGAYHDCSGYALQIYTDGTNWYYVLKKNNGAVMQSVAITGDDIKGPYEMEFGYRDIKLGDNVVGKQVYLKKNGETILTYDDTSNWLTGDSLTNVVTVWGYCASIQMDTTNVTSYGDVTTYDISELTGSEENYYYGTAGSAVGGHDEWSGTTIGDVSGDKENIGFKATVTKTAEYQARLSLGALDTANAVDCAGYALRIDDSYVDICRNDQALLTITSVDMTGTYVLEFSIQSILVNGEVTGKRLTVKKDGAVIGTYDDLSGFLTGDTLGTKIAVFTYGNGIQMDTTYTNGYGEVTVYDIYDLDGSTSKTLAGIDGGATWDYGQLVGNFPTDSKENVAFKTKVTVSTTGKQYRFSFGALDNTKCLDPMGYGFTLNLTDNVLRFARNNVDLGDSVSIDPADYIGTWELEFGYRDIIEKNVVVGKQVYMLKDGVEIYRYDDKSGYLTGDSLGTIISVFHYANSITMESLYETSYGEVTVYDISDLTGNNSTTVNGALNSDWAGTSLGTVAADKKENIALKAKVTIDSVALYGTQTDLIRLSLSASTSSFVDCSGYSMRIYTDNSGNWYYGINKNGNGDAKASSAAMTENDILGTYELEFGYRDIIFNGNVIGKQVYLKKGGEVIVSYDDTSDYLTGNSLTTTVSAWGYCASFNLDTTLPASFVHGYNLTLGGRTAMNLYLDTGVINDDAATITIKIEGEKASQTYALQELPIGVNGFPMVTAKLASGQMNDTVTVTATRSNGETEEKTYSVAGYANYILSQDYSDETKQLVTDMLHYGAAAQEYFDYNAENLANNGITDNENNEIQAPAKSVEGSVDGVSIYGASLILRDDTTLRYYLNITGDVNDYTFSINGEEAAPRKVSGTGVNYCVQYDGILPNRLGDVYTLIISKGSSTMTVNYSPTNYMQNIYSKGGESQLLAQQLYDYYCSAKAYSADAVIDTPVILDLYQVAGQSSVTVPLNEAYQLGMLVGADGSFVEKELTNNVALRFKYTAGDQGIRLMFGTDATSIAGTVGGGLFMSVPAHQFFGVANIEDNGQWCYDANGNQQSAWADNLAVGQTAYVEIGCVKVYTNGVYTHDRYYAKAANTLEALDAITVGHDAYKYYDTTMRDNNGHKVVILNRDNATVADVLGTTWTEDEIQAYEAKANAIPDASDYDALEEKYPDAVDTSNTASSLATAKNPTGSTTATGGDELILWAESGASKIAQDDDGKAATQAEQKNTLSIQMAKNEYEGAQLMLFGNRNVEAYEVFVTDLTSGSNVITADNIRLYQLKYLTVDDKYSGSIETYDSPYAAGAKLPDGMLPFAKAVEYGENVILAGNNQSIYVDVSTDAATAAGTYTGTIVVKTNTNGVYTLPISVVVQDVVMPENSALGTYAPYLSREAFSTGELDGSDEMASQYVQTLEEFNMSSIIPASDGVMNLEKFLVNVRRYYDSATNYMLPIDNSDGYYNGELVYCNYALLKEYIVALAKMSVADGVCYLDKAFFYPSDHVDEAITEEQFTLAQETYAAFLQVLADADTELTEIYGSDTAYTAKVQASVLGLRFLLTIPGDDTDGRTLDIGGLIDDYFPKSNADNKNLITCTSSQVLVRPEYYGDSTDEAVGTRELWTYVSLKPWYPHSNYAFDTPVVGLRTLGWTCYQEGIDTLMTWKSVNYLYEANGQSLDRWTTSSSGEEHYTPGDGNIFYPGAKYGIDGPCPSLRAMAWRDGVDDYNLMNVVVENGGSADSLTSLYGMITETITESIKTSSETGSWWGSLISKTVNATVPIDDDAKFIIVRNALLQMAASGTSNHATIVSNAQTAVNNVTAATGTTSAQETPNAESTATINSNIYTNGYYQLADFETYTETVQNKLIGSAKLELSSFAANGSGSLKVAVQPGQSGQTVWIPTTSKYFSATTDFSGASKITFWVYNAQGTDSTVRFYLNTFDRTTDDKSVYGAGTYQKDDADIWHDDYSSNKSIRKTLTHGWNEITITASELGTDYLSYVGAFIIAFDSGVGCDAQQVYYLDDVRVYMTQVS